MGVTSALAPSSKGPQQQPTATHLAGRKLLVARVLWGALGSLALGLFVVLLPTYWTLLQTVCTAGPCALVQPTADVIHALHQFSLPLSDYAAGTFTLTLVTTAVCSGIGGLLFWRRSNDWMALLVSLAEVAFGVLFVTDAVQATSSAWQVPAICLNVLGNGVIFLLGYLFPSGAPIPRWSRWLILGWFGWGACFTLLHALPGAYLLDNAAWLALLACLVVAQIYRYRYRSTLIQRQQTKWVVFGGGLTGLLLVGLTLPRLVFPLVGQSDALYTFATGPLYPLGALLVSLALALAMFRYRLFDLDRLINRTLVYGVLTGLLGALYAGLIIGLESLVGLFSGHAASTPVVLVISTLAIAALFHPLRRRIQHLIDRRFYRQQYTAEHVLTAFQATLRSEVDLERLSAQLVAVIEETMHPTFVSLWLRPPSPSSGRLDPPVRAPRAELQEQVAEPASPSSGEGGAQTAAPPPGGADVMGVAQREVPQP